MVSTLAGFNVISSDLQATLRQTAADPIVSRDAQYYRDNIGKVKSADDFVGDYRLFSYAMKAYGLEEMTYAGAFMKKVLESDLSDSSSFANQLSDVRYRDFAAAFNFDADGSVETTAFDGQSSAQEDATIGLYTQNATDRLTSVDTETAYYKATIGNVTSLDDFMSNQSLVDYALKANGIDTTFASNDTLRKVLTSDLSDPSSFANQLGSDAYIGLAKSYNFAADGSLPEGTPAQSESDIATATADYGFFEAGTLTPRMAKDNTDYVTQSLGSITSVDDLLSDNRLYTYVLTAFGLDPYSTDSQSVRQALTSDPADPDSFANTETGGNYSGLAAAFNFGADGTVADGEKVVSDEDLDTLTGAYLTHYDDSDEARTAKATTYFQQASAKVTSVDDLLDDSQLYDYVLQAYGIDPSATNRSQIKQVLTSDPADPTGYVGRLHDSRFTQLAAAFNFAPGGEADAPDVAQTTAQKQSTESDYAALVATGTVTSDKARSETTYYDANIGKVTSLDALLNDSRLVDYAMLASGVDPKTVSASDLKRALTSDLSDSKSYANTGATPALRELAARFNFSADGTLGKQPAGTVQSKVNIVKTGDLYVRQTLEENEGEENTGVRLALYFERKAPEITSAYDILADSALLQVVQTALGLSSDTGSADIDLQANYIENNLDIASLQDPDKLQQFLGRFATLYDSDNGTDTDPTLALFSNTSGSTGISADLMLSIAQLGTA